MKYKIIAVDMDGTLLNDEKSISKYNLDMVCEAEKLGVKIVMATGRLPSSLKFYSRGLFKDQPVICCNGAIVLDGKGNIIKSSPVDKYNILEIIDILREKKIHIIIFTMVKDFIASSSSILQRDFMNSTEKWIENSGLR